MYINSHTSLVINRTASAHDILALANNTPAKRPESIVHYRYKIRKDNNKKRKVSIDWL